MTPQNGVKICALSSSTSFISPFDRCPNPTSAPPAGGTHVCRRSGVAEPAPRRRSRRRCRRCVSCCEPAASVARPKSRARCGPVNRIPSHRWNCVVCFTLPLTPVCPLFPSRHNPCKVDKSLRGKPLLMFVEILSVTASDAVCCIKLTKG